MSLNNDETKVEILRLVDEECSYRQIEEKTGISRSAVHKFVTKQSYKQWWATRVKPVAGGNLYDHRANIKRMPGSRFILTSAQNNTYVHSGFVKSLETMAEHLDARIVVGTFSYNLNGFQNLTKGSAEWFDPMIEEYILDQPSELAEGLIWCGELNILPTAVNPLSGFASYTGTSSGIIPHAKVQMESLPTHKEKEARMLYTTGSVTKRNYVQKKAGQKASFHHVFGALLVEVDDDGDWFVRQLIADSSNGYFQDLDKIYTPQGVISDQRVEAINWGDLHSEKKDEQVYQTSFGKTGDSILDTLKPKYQFVHDVLDFEARNHHNIKDPYFLFKQYNKQEESVEGNVDKVIHTLRMLDRVGTYTVIVESNHDLALKRWLKNSDYKTDPVNAIFYLENQLAVYKAIEQGDDSFNVLENAVKTKAPDLSQMKFLKEDESFMICGPDGIECGQHSHNGANGSRGGIGIYQKLGNKYTIGHSHSAGIKDGVYQAGVSGNLDMGYNVGASSWSHSHVVTYPNGKRSVITLKNGKYRA